MKTRRPLQQKLVSLLLAVTLMAALAPEVLGAPPLVPISSPSRTLPAGASRPAPAKPALAKPALAEPTFGEPTLGVGAYRGSGQAPATTENEWDSLPPEMRAILTLRYYEELSTPEIAQTLEIPEGTVRSRLHYARLTMAGLLDPFMEQARSARAKERE